MSEENVFDIKKAREFYFDDTKITNPDGYTKQLITLIREAINNENIEKIKLLDMIIGNHVQSGLRINEGFVYFPN
jgi:ribonucleotide reductase beta subunit family protein with ferritin-like domain